VATDPEIVLSFHFSQLKEEYNRKLAVGLIASLAVLLPVLLPTEQVLMIKLLQFSTSLVVMGSSINDVKVVSKILWQ
jgi:hypothetical protein